MLRPAVRFLLIFPACSGQSQLYPEQWQFQPRDHFEGSKTGPWWPQRYWEDLQYYRREGLAFLMLCGEEEATSVPLTGGQWHKWALQFGAAMFVLEHRYYGQSKPTGDLSTENMKFLSSRQSLEDAGLFISAMNQRYNLSTWITFGGSYAGSLSAWMRLRFPHLVTGSVSSSGPLLAKLDYYEYLQGVARALDTTGPGCNLAIREAVTRLVRMVQTKETWQELSRKFKLCSSLDGVNRLDVMNLEYLLFEILGFTVQFDDRNKTNIATLCALMTNVLPNVSLPDPVDRLAYVNAMKMKLTGEQCVDHTYQTFLRALTNITWPPGGSDQKYPKIWSRQWTWQSCTEFGWYPTAYPDSSVYGISVPVDFFERRCVEAFGDGIQWQWHTVRQTLANNVAITNSQYGGLHPSLSNVVFVHGSLDPWYNNLGVVKDLNVNTPVIIIPGASHCNDMFPDSPTDSEQLRAARLRIGELVKSWICQKISSVCLKKS